MNQAKTTHPLAEKAQKAYAASQYALSADLYGQAAEACQSAGDSLQAAEMRNNQSVALLKAGNPTEALQAVEGTAGIFEQAGDHRRQAMALGNRASALEELRRFREALQDYLQAAELLKGSGGEDMRALLLKRISALQMRLNKPVEALFSMDAAVESSPRRTWSERLIRRLMAVIKRSSGFD